MWLILILSGAALVLFSYSNQRLKERREDRHERLRDLRQKELARLLAKDDDSDSLEGK